MSAELPKAILYSYDHSVWSTVPRLCLYEKGYGDDEYVVKHVDISKGENFAPSYLKINMHGTVPTLVVPMLETTGAEVASRYRSLRDTISICEFLDQARSPHTHNTTSDRPAPVLSPATIEGKSVSDSLIALCHLPSVDPNFLVIACQSPEELRTKAAGSQGAMLSARHDALQTYLKEAKQIAADSPLSSSKDKGLTYEQKTVVFLEEKATANEVVWEIYNGKAGEEREKAFFVASKKVWTHGIPDVLRKMESYIRGPYLLGDQVCLADLHVIAWLSRIIELSGGTKTASGIEALESLTGHKVGPKMKAFWALWIERPSFKSM
ncbi:hypothetical protein M231_07556 [Tremella mesenterica]|uniref:GST N-terminal domain-containing protein n=1 Tax=Tremella mesenterica TaxID=5217 RepID=A0A4Q1BDZ6_TREME|nr:hypothetical protein M231_07556 [Tremella mesenterica]